VKEALMNNKKGVLSLIGVFLLSSISLFSEEPSRMTKEIQDAINAKGAKWVAGDTSVSNLSYEEQMQKVGFNFAPIKAEPITDLDEKVLPSSLDWRDYNGKDYVSGVRDQGKCGSCWAFSMTAGLEAYVLKTNDMSGQDIDLSEQIMISCSGAGSCNGGSLDASYLVDTGLPPESYYPYTQKDGSCSSAKPGWQDKAYRIGSFGTVSQSVSAMKAALAKYGPIPTAMMVYQDLMSYKSGVYSYTTGKKLGGIAVFLVGYNDDEQYFIVKNSWGPGWGEDGFFKISYSELKSVVKFGLSRIAYKTPDINREVSKKVDVSIDDINSKDIEKVMPMIQPAFDWK
jgi:C1A family cysteine protease